MKGEGTGLRDQWSWEWGSKKDLGKPGTMARFLTRLSGGAGESQGQQSLRERKTEEEAGLREK